jgi:hypothetical protein
MALPRRALSQDLLWQRVGVDNSLIVGGRVVVVGDVNSDGFDDLATIVGFGTGGMVHSPVWILSGRDGATLRAGADPAPNYFRTLSAATDWDSDGVPDYAVTEVDQTPTFLPPAVQVRGGRDDRVLVKIRGDAWNSLFGWALVADADVDGDRQADIVVTVPNGSAYGEVRAYSHGGILLWRARGTATLAFGYQQTRTHLARLGDVNRDGMDDVVVGGSGVGGGAGIVLSGRDGSVLTVGYSPDPPEYVGISVAGCGDLDRDGVPDFAAGTSFDVRVYSAVYAFSGRTGAVLQRWYGRSVGATLGSSLAGGRDLDGDGIPDVVVGATGEQVPGFGVGSAYALSGRDGATLFELHVPSTSGQSYLGDEVAALGPQPGSPFGCWLVCEPLYQPRPNQTPHALGRIMLFRGVPPGMQAFGASCAGTLATTPRIGARNQGSGQLRVQVSGAAPGQPAVLILGLSRTQWLGQSLPWSLSPLGFPGCRLLCSADVLDVTRCGSTGIDAGYGFVDLPRLPAPTPFFAQRLALGVGASAPGGVSDALELR